MLSAYRHRFEKIAYWADWYSSNELYGPIWLLKEHRRKETTSKWVCRFTIFRFLHNMVGENPPVGLQKAAEAWQSQGWALSWLMTLLLPFLYPNNSSGKNMAQKEIQLLILHWLYFKRKWQSCVPFMEGQILLGLMKGHYTTEKKKKEENVYLPVRITVIKCF